MKPYPALCKDCKWSKPEERSEWNLKCHNPVVNANDPYALSNSGNSGGWSDCTSNRKGGFFDACGMRGKLWEAK